MSKTLDELEADLEAAGIARAATYQARKDFFEANKEVLREMNRLADADHEAGKACEDAHDALRRGYIDAMKEQRKASK